MPTLGLLFHELATNAAKYGGLSTADSRLSIQIAVAGETAEIRRPESRGQKRANGAQTSQGFGSRLEQTSVKTLHGTLDRAWSDAGWEIRLTFPLAQIAR